MLTPFIPYDPTETIHSYAARLAMVHTGQGAARLLTDLGIPPARFRSGDPEAVERLAGSAGENPSSLQAATIRTLKRYNTFRGDDFSRSVLSPRVRQFCPHCLREDGAEENWRHRLAWCFLPVPDCHRHGLTMLEVDAVDIDDVRDAVQAAGGLTVAETGTEAAGAGTHAAWLHQRLAGQGAMNWLDDQTIEQVLNASEMLGLVLEHGQQIRPATLSRVQRNQALALGFEIYEQGPDAVYAALSDIRGRSAATAVQSGPLAMYGILYDWLSRRSQMIAPGPIRNILREHILDHDAYMSGEKLLGEWVMERRLHSVKSLALTLKVDRRRMSRLLQKLGMVPQGATDAESGRLVFPVREVEQLVQDYNDPVPLAELPGYVGGTQTQTQGLYRAGVFPALIPADAPGAVRGVIFARRMLDDFLTAIAALPVLEDGERDAVLSIGEACQRHGGTTDALISAVMSGKVAGFRMPGDARLHGLLVLKTDVVAFRRAALKVAETP
ncbi:hypothetical protein GVY41_19550 [Frigidibacter albus]|uniref:TniQ domain-containing protein n=1 Tax=Frigidibacter albus TaxID=1465486 RepID=A0A6L8VN78_9RHOB|nr:TniQ family protein [Frigidibacter albus]MZQ91271.1 hypothetical protein [Frigidibacter albus]NBE33192.1 hypothetical protein [Frigidibacter albus]GGH63715.1 hypothetical protein GCM10011341_39050 [Frigidibacter albus]